MRCTDGQNLRIDRSIDRHTCTYQLGIMREHIIVSMAKTYRLMPICRSVDMHTCADRSICCPTMVLAWASCCPTMPRLGATGAHPLSWLGRCAFHPCLGWEPLLPNHGHGLGFVLSYHASDWGHCCPSMAMSRASCFPAMPRGFGFVFPTLVPVWVSCSPAMFLARASVCLCPPPHHPNTLPLSREEDALSASGLQIHLKTQRVCAGRLPWSGAELLASG